jgi:uncharacterized protein (DUF4415 family)
MRVEWDEQKNRQDLRKHDVRFETAILVFDDPLPLRNPTLLLKIRIDGHERKLMRKLTREQKRDIQAIAAKRDEDIDFSDASPVLDWSAAEIGKFYRPKKEPVTMRLDSDVIAWLKADGRGYQTKANWLLRSAMLHFTREAHDSRRIVTPQRGKARRRKQG